ncbi:hypothetical protein SLS60_005174 [Paraconiothyrium brasiliense]|uniref:PWWP domain-containing protein n=1 Tax=Paraconiothyrium brasiliense TaxID=300254 RepID=A0ABR3RGP2_9PLEO
MAEEAATPVAVDATKVVDEPTRSADAAEPGQGTEEKPSERGDVPADAPVEEQAPEAAAATDDQAAKDDAADAKPDAAVAESSGDVAAAEELTATNGTPASGKKANNNRRKSTGGVPEHKGKKTPGKKGKKEIKLNLNTKPGDMWLVAMRGYQPWPVIIADEDMLPETLLAKRPVSALRLDGTYREDFEEGGRNAKDRKYPVMFLGTNEFAWQPNTDLIPFHLDEIKKEVESGNSTKKNKQLWEAYEIAAEGHDLSYFKDILVHHEQAVQEDELAKEAKREEKAEKAAKKAAKRKSTAAAEEEDVEMGDADDTAAASAKKAKPTKKRKKEADSEGDEEKPAKTPKTTLKLTNKKKPAAESKKSKLAAKEDSEPAQPEEPPMTEEERLEKRKKTVLYLRHRLQKGFLDRAKPPQDEDMSNMSGYMTQLEELKNLEPEIIKETKVHKVLKGILKLPEVPRDEEFKIKSRSQDLLNKWGTLSAGEHAAEETAAPATNGVKPEEKKADEPAPEKKEEIAPSASEEAKPKDADGDVAMAESAPESKEVAPAAETNGDTKTAQPADAMETAA